MRAYKLLSGHDYYEVHDLKKERWWTAKRQNDGSGIAERPTITEEFEI